MSYLNERQQEKLIKHIKKWTDDPCTNYLVSGIPSYNQLSYVYTDRSIFNFSNNDDQGGALLIVDFKYKFDGLSPESRKKHNIEKYYEDLYDPNLKYLSGLCRCLKTKLPYSWTLGVTVTDKGMKNDDVLTLNFSIAENILVAYPNPDNKKLSLVFQDAMRVLSNYSSDSFTESTTFPTLIKSEDLSKFKEIYPNKVTEE